MFRQNRLRMELDSKSRMVAVLEAHDFALGGEGGDFETIRHRLQEDERVVAGGLEGRGDAVEQASAIVMNGRGLAVHQPRRASDRSAVDRAQALMPQADAEDRNLSGE